VVKITDASPEVVDQFLTFLYTGKLKDKRRKGNDDDEPVWVQMLPQIIYIADKVNLNKTPVVICCPFTNMVDGCLYNLQYDVKDLIEFCDLNLHRAASKANIAEIFKVASRHGLLKAQAKLREQK